MSFYIAFVNDIKTILVTEFVKDWGIGIMRGSYSVNIVSFKMHEDAFITIRNVPYTSLEILAVNGSEKKTYAPARGKRGYVVVTDVTQPLQYDFLITLKDKVKVTNEGEYVVGGNKLKVGLPIILEGKDYRFNGVVSSIQPYEDFKEQTDLDGELDE